MARPEDASSPLFRFDEALRSSHPGLRLAGLDEAGRGPLAGPVVAAAVVFDFPLSQELAGVRDSKAVTPAFRERLFALVRRSSFRSAVGWALPEEIDRHNILQATFLAMRRAFDRLRLDPSRVLAVVDGPHAVAGLACRQETVIAGDAKSLCVAGASILAKVVRDRWMERLHRAYPGYGFSSHKGYGTAAHLEALSRLGPCPLHRKSFEPVARLLRAAQAA